MEVTIKGVQALRQLRFELQEDSGAGFPHDVLTQLLMLHDVCKCLDLTIFQARHVLGDIGWQYVKEYIERPAYISFNKQAVQCIDGEYSIVE